MEIWRNVKDYEDYFLVSCKGRIFSKRSGKILKPHTGKSGYVTISTKIGGRKGKTICFRIHRLVAEAFIDNPESKPYVNHIDSNRSNNQALNLEWVTAKENWHHGKKHGSINIFLAASKQNSIKERKLKKQDIQYIRANYTPFCHHNGARALGRKFSVDKQRILDVISGITYRDI